MSEIAVYFISILTAKCTVSRNHTANFWWRTVSAAFYRQSDLSSLLLHIQRQANITLKRKVCRLKKLFQ